MKCFHEYYLSNIIRGLIGPYTFIIIYSRLFFPILPHNEYLFFSRVIFFHLLCWWLWEDGMAKKNYPKYYSSYLNHIYGTRQYLESQNKKDPQSIKTSVKVPKCSDFNKIRLGLSFSCSNMVTTTLQVDAHSVTVEKVWREEILCQKHHTMYIDIPHFLAVYHPNAQKNVIFYPMASLTYGIFLT